MITEYTDFRQRVGEALANRYSEKEPSPHVEQQIYDGFASSRDQTLMQTVPRCAMGGSASGRDGNGRLRMRRIAQRLIYFERPEALPEKTREALSKEVQARLNAHDDVLPWRTVADARQELAKIQSEGVDGSLAGFISNMDAFLAGLLK